MYYKQRYIPLSNFLVCTNTLDTYRCASETYFLGIFPYKLISPFPNPLKIHLKAI